MMSFISISPSMVFPRSVIAFLLVLLLTACGAGGPVHGDGGSAIAGAELDTQGGHLVVVGGGPRPSEIMNHFIELAGGPGVARIAIFPTSSSDPEGSGRDLVDEMLELGAASAVSFPITREEATEVIAEQLEDMTGIWFAGGSQTRHTAILKDTPVEEAVHEFYRSGGVIGGTSAGAAIMSEIMITGGEAHPGGDRPSQESYITIDRDNIETAPGIGFLSDLIIDQHFVRRKRHNRLITLALEHPDLIAAGIDEETAIVVRPDRSWQIIGNGIVVVYDPRDAQITSVGEPILGGVDLRMHILIPGSIFDPASGVANLPEVSS